MNWRVTHRDKDGRQTTSVFEAECRDTLFRLLAAKGINAIRVEEANGKAGSLDSQCGISSRWIVLIGAAIIIAIGGFSLLSSMRNSGNTSKDGKSPNRAVVTRKSESAIRPSSNRLDTISQDVSQRHIKDKTLPHKKIVEMISVITNIDGSVLERFRTADGKIRSRQSAPRPIFDNASDQIIAMAASGAESGSVMPPMPMMNNADEEFIKSLEREIVINDDDSDAVKSLKKNVMAIREEIRQLINEGHSFAEVIREHRDIVNHGVEMRREAIRTIKEFVDGSDREAAKECLEKVNEVLAGMGIQGVEMPLTDEERRAQIRERHRNEK